MTPFFLLTRRPHRSALFPYTTLFRSVIELDAWFVDGAGTWYDMRSQQQRQFASLNAVSVKEVPSALATLLKTDFVLDLLDRKSTRLNSSHRCISYAVFCLKKKTGHSS